MHSIPAPSSAAESARAWRSPACGNWRSPRTRPPAECRPPAAGAGNPPAAGPRSRWWRCAAGPCRQPNAGRGHASPDMCVTRAASLRRTPPCLSSPSPSRRAASPCRAARHRPRGRPQSRRDDLSRHQHLSDRDAGGLRRARPRAGRCRARPRRPRRRVRPDRAHPAQPRASRPFGRGRGAAAATGAPVHAYSPSAAPDPALEDGDDGRRADGAAHAGPCLRSSLLRRRRRHAVLGRSRDELEQQRGQPAGRRHGRAISPASAVCSRATTASICPATARLCPSHAIWSPNCCATARRARRRSQRHSGGIRSAPRSLWRGFTAKSIPRCCAPPSAP